MSGDLVIQGEVLPTEYAGNVFEALSPALIEQRHQQFVMIHTKIKEMLVEGRDFGYPTARSQEDVANLKKRGIPPSLYVPGAERVKYYIGYVPRYTVLPGSAIDRDKGEYHFMVQCDLIHGDRILGSALASCSSKESKYVNLWKTEYQIKQDPQFDGLDLSRLQKRVSPWNKQDFQFNVGPHVAGFDHENTCLQMACKRALVMATRRTFALTDSFGDLDLPDHLYDIDIESTPVHRPSKAERQASKGTTKKAPPIPSAQKGGDSVAEAVFSEWADNLRRAGCGPEGLDYAERTLLTWKNKDHLYELDVTDPEAFMTYLITKLEPEVAKRGHLPEPGSEG